MEYSWKNTSLVYIHRSTSIQHAVGFAYTLHHAEYSWKDYSLVYIQSSVSVQHAIRFTYTLHHVQHARETCQMFVKNYQLCQHYVGLKQVSFRKHRGIRNCVTAAARKRSRSFCQKCRWQVTAKQAYTLRMWICMKWHGAWLHGVDKTCAETAAVSCGTSHTTSVDI